MSTTVTSTGPHETGATSSLEAAAARLALLLTAPGGPVGDRADGPGALEFEAVVELRPLDAHGAAGRRVGGRRRPGAGGRRPVPAAARHPRRRGCASATARCVLEEEGELRAALLGGVEGRTAAGRARRRRCRPTRSVDVNLLRDRWEWDAVERCVAEAEPGALVLVDGDLQPDWRIPSTYLRRAARPRPRRARRARRRHQALVARAWRRAAARPARAARPSRSVRATRAHVVGAGRPHPCRRARRVDAACRSSRPGSTPTPASRSASTCRPTSTPSPRSASSAALCDDAAFPGYPYPLTRGRPAGRVPGLAAPRGAPAARRPLRPRRRARSRCASAPSPTATT